MCGIAGIVHSEASDRDTLLSRLDALAAALRHRGPDDRGTWAAADGSAGLAHVRLSILDLSRAGHQPMQTPDGGLHITFNGEIYNFQELRGALEREGVIFHTRTDTEVLLRLYERDGEAMLAKLRGMFAFAIWDAPKRRCFLARDPLGIKPLYYTMRGGRLAFASELRALQAAGVAGGGLDTGALMGYFKTGSVAEPHTLLTDVHSLEAGHYLIWHNGRLARKCYWRMGFAPEEMAPARAVAEVREALVESMAAHFVSDVPVGVFLSGGIDSTALVALAQEAGHRELATFSIGVDDDGLDESSAAKRTAAHFGTQHHEMRLNAAAASVLFEEFLRAIDQPGIDGLNTFSVSAFARQQGMKVVLSGLGGDELFAGYKSFDAVPRLASAARMARLIPGAGSAAGWMMERFAPSHKLRRIGSLLQRPASIQGAAACFRGIFSTHEARLLAAGYLDCSPDNIRSWPDQPLRARDPRDAVSECELRFYMRNQLLKDSDVMSMAHGLELRVPLVDRVLFERMSRIPPALRLRSGKQMLLEAVPEIPKWVSGAPKRGFVFPFEKWLKEQWDESFARATARAPFKKPTWYQRWSIFMLDTWLERHGLN